MRIPIIAANWKMHHDTDSASEFLQRFLALSSSVGKVEVLISPPFTLLALSRGLLADSDIKLAGQNFYPATDGAFTGEISPSMLRRAGCEYVIVGHSERRQLFHESDEFIAEKVRFALEIDLKPIICVGETFDERMAGQTEKVLAHQLDSTLSDLELTSNQEIVIAYEPVWAIGTGETASPEDAQAGASFVRDNIQKILGSETANRTRIQYGGSVKPDNAAEILSMPDVDGALVGGASLDPDSFYAIVKAAQEAS